MPTVTLQIGHPLEAVMERGTRTTATALAGAALLVGAVGTAMAVVDPAPGAGRSTAAGLAPGPRGGPALTARATATGVRAWQGFRVHGTAEELRPGTRVALQQRQGRRWVTLPAAMSLTRESAYRMRVRLGIQGRNTLRIVGGGRASAPFVVQVRR
ncbi:hypothetical protein [Streptomyces sp. NPDC014894]|uniref:hypothetical protein n=1 Tax=Streptomyces sp. NPDC014894 TaxID=3364931 RepID=UPI0036FA4B5D